MQCDIDEIIYPTLYVLEEVIYSKTGVKGPLKNRQNKDLEDKW